jgi:hypothetical protein
MSPYDAVSSSPQPAGTAGAPKYAKLSDDNVKSTRAGRGKSKGIPVPIENMEFASGKCLQNHDHEHAHEHLTIADMVEQQLNKDLNVKNLHVKMSLHNLSAHVDSKCPNTGYVLNATNSNPLVMFQLQELRHFSWIHQLAMIASLVYVAMMVTLFFLNTLRCYFFTHPGDGGDANRPNGESWERGFHLMEFWSNAGFNVVMGVVLYNSTSDELHKETLRWPTLIKRFALLDIVTAFVAAFLNAVDQEFFEPYAHNLEYLTTIMMMIIDYMMWRGLANVTATTSDSRKSLQLPVLLTVGLLMLVLYNVLPDPWNEYAAHFLEHPTDMIGGLVVFYTSAESKRKADLATFHLMYRPCRHGEKPAVAALPKEEV